MVTDRTWQFTTYGTSVELEDNGYSGSVEENNLRVYSLHGKGKLVPASTDGLAFYYTTIDPQRENFTLSADVYVEQWTFSNGQDGFGLMAADAIGEMGEDKSFWNNAYMTAVTRSEYIYDKQNQRVLEGNLPHAANLLGRVARRKQYCKYTMKLGVCAMEKRGVAEETKETQLLGGHPDFTSTTRPLETLAADRNLPEGSYNMVANYTNTEAEMGDIAALKRFHLTLTRNNSGYQLGYTNEEGKTTTQFFYFRNSLKETGERDELTRLDKEHIYVGFFAARNACIRVENVKLDIVSPWEDAPAEEQPLRKVAPVYQVESASYANRPEYTLVYCGNAEGVLTVTGDQGEPLLREQKVSVWEKYCLPVQLHQGENLFHLRFAPDSDYRPEEGAMLENYEPRETIHKVYFPGGTAADCYISPKGRADAPGTREEPRDIYTAVRCPLPGQHLILLGGRYLLEQTLVIERGIDGREGQEIYLMADPDRQEPVVLDFQRKGAGLRMAGNYWVLQDFEITGSRAAANGLRMGGSHNRVERLNVYGNGNTGIQLSRYRETDEWEEWPSHNYIYGCSSYLNADPGYTDADGFAAKITVAEGNVFEQCISAYNADDGFDLFEKVERGSTGAVTIRKCLAFRNGYTIEQGRERRVGVGNGFKLGGSSLPGGHVLEDSIAFANGARGIDSNTCPDVHVFRCTSFDNEGPNVALYTKDAEHTDYLARGILSFRSARRGISEEIECRGNQNLDKVYHASNYYCDGVRSTNTKGNQAAENWFASLDTRAALEGGIQRNGDGHIALDGFLELTEDAPKETGARI